VSVLVVPTLDKRPWPSLGGLICDWIETNLVFGPGDLRGQRARLDDEKRGLIYRMYEVHPRGTNEAGRRRFRRVAISLRKGSAKTEMAAWIAAAELAPDSPVRCVGFDKKGNPIGGPVTDPYIPMVAYTEEQTEDLAYGALRVILELSPIAGDFDIGLERIMRINGDGKAEALATAPSSRDGARTTFQHFDETHHMTLPRLKKAHRAMLANIPKRMLADAWSLETTTAPAPGEGSVAEDTMEFARAVAEGRTRAATLFFFHRQASDHHDLETVHGLKEAIKEASGPVAKWSNLSGILDQWKDPTADKTYLARVWLNKIVRSADRAFDSERWKQLHRKNHIVPDRAAITIGFDGARTFDSTGLVATEIKTGYQWPLGLWERPFGAKEWEVPVLEVNAVVEEAFKRYGVWRMYADPPYWESVVAEWSGKYGEEKVILWPTYRPRPMGHAVRGYFNAIQGRELSHDGNADFARHVANAFRRDLRIRDDKGEPLWTVQKERPDSPMKIDLCVCGVISWEARTDAIAAGIGETKTSVYEARGLVTL
jgi:hypothetical protein